MQLLELRLFPSTKELTESFACFHAARTHLRTTFAPEDPDVLLLAVGDGEGQRAQVSYLELGEALLARVGCVSPPGVRQMQRARAFFAKRNECLPT